MLHLEFRHLKNKLREQRMHIHVHVTRHYKWCGLPMPPGPLLPPGPICFPTPAHCGRVQTVLAPVSPSPLACANRPPPKEYICRRPPRGHLAPKPSSGPAADVRRGLGGSLWLQGRASPSRHRLSVPAAESTMAQQPWTPRPVGWRPACARGQCGLGSCPLTCTCTCTDQAERSRPADRDGAVRPQRAAHSGPARTDADQSGRGCARLSAQVGFASASRGRPRGSFLAPGFPEDCIVGVA